MLTAILPTLLKNDPCSRKPVLLRPAASLIPRYDLRAPVPPRHVRLLIGEDVFCEHDAPQL